MQRLGRSARRGARVDPKTPPTKFSFHRSVQLSRWKIKHATVSLPINWLGMFWEWTIIKGCSTYSNYMCSRILQWSFNKSLRSHNTKQKIITCLLPLRTIKFKQTILSVKIQIWLKQLQLNLAVFTIKNKYLLKTLNFIYIILKYLTIIFT